MPNVALGLEFDNSVYYKNFRFNHLPDHLQVVSIPFYSLAKATYERMNPSSAHSVTETEAALRKLVEAKDCAVRAVL